MSLFNFKRKSRLPEGVVDIKATEVRDAAKPPGKSGATASSPLPTTSLISTEVAPFFARMMPARRLQLPSALRVIPLAIYLMAFLAVAALALFNLKSRAAIASKAAVLAETARIEAESRDLADKLEATNARFGIAGQVVLWAQHTAGSQPILVACAEAFNERVQVNALSLEQKDHNSLQLTLKFQAMGDPEKFASLQDDLIKRLAALGWMVDGEPSENGPQINYTGTLTRMSR